ncbi:VOC family protein [Alcaligenaceae bacterium SAGV3]|nr:VOC family protein [Alcaligenaceae bacterium SAGV3]
MEKVAFRPRRLGHVNLYVSDLEASLSFYERHCGLARVRMESAIGAGFLSNGNTHHDLGLIEISRGQDRHGRDGHVQIQSTRGRQPGLNHLGWEMENQAALVQAYERMRAAGMAPQALYDHIISHAVYVPDPDGNVHEFYADSMKDWESVFNLDHDDLVTSRWDPLASERSTTPNYNPAPNLRRPAPRVHARPANRANSGKSRAAGPASLRPTAGRPTPPVKDGSRTLSLSLRSTICMP